MTLTLTLILIRQCLPADSPWYCAIHNEIILNVLFSLMYLIPRYSTTARRVSELAGLPAIVVCVITHNE